MNWFIVLIKHWTNTSFLPLSNDKMNYILPFVYDFSVTSVVTFVIHVHILGV